MFSRVDVTSDVSVVGNQFPCTTWIVFLQYVSSFMKFDGLFEVLFFQCLKFKVQRFDIQDKRCSVSKCFK